MPLLRRLFYFCDPAGIRTRDPILKRDVLYQLSYRTSFLKALQIYYLIYFIKRFIILISLIQIAVVTNTDNQRINRYVYNFTVIITYQELLFQN